MVAAAVVELRHYGPHLFLEVDLDGCSEHR